MTETPPTLPFPILPADHPALAIIRDCMLLSTGTLSYLCASTNYDEIYAVRREWIRYLANHPDLSGKCENWVQAWWMFWRVFCEEVK